jgi:BTB/POZ domain
VHRINDFKNKIVVVYSLRAIIISMLAGDIITFDIGGKIYRASKSILAKYPGTMLYIAASGIEESNHDKPIFIDGNGERFQYVLDYIRFRKVELPSHIGIESFVNDLDYYGFVHVDQEQVENLWEKRKRNDRMSLLCARCIASRYHHNRNRSGCTTEIEEERIGISILLDKNHKESNRYHRTLATMLDEYNLHVKCQNGFLMVVANDERNWNSPFYL